ncbi:MAG TPA: response regulator transcription factor [Thermoflexia bacterium]|nr:response regulator transcription factor [Thermoflexia bacterium]
MEAIRAVVQGQPWYSPRVQGEVRAWLQGPVAAPPEVAALTARERAVLRLLARGASNREIAVMLDISVHTVAHHVSHVLGKLGTPHRVVAALRVIKDG